MTDKEEHGSASGASFHILQPNRDPESNWAVDLAKNLEDYLLKICSGEITAEDEDGHPSVNFAEAALLIQGSIQVYSRKVEYLYSLVLHALEFISQKRQDQPEETTARPDGTESSVVVDEENDRFLGLDDVPVEAKTRLDDGFGEDEAFNHFVKPPANLLVLEGDCLDTTGEAGELESYLLATSDLYRDFLLLDPCDAGAVDDFLKGNNAGQEHSMAHRGSSTRSKAQKTLLQSPRSGGSAHKSNLGKSPHGYLNQTPGINHDFKINNNVWDDTDIAHDLPENNMHHGEEPDGGFSEPRDDSDDDDDPWKPLNPHEPGDLKVKPFKKGKFGGKQRKSSTKQNSLAAQFPLARLEGTINPEFAETLEAQLHARERVQASQSPSLYEKLRQSLVLGESETYGGFDDPMDGNEDHEFENDLPDFEQAENIYMDAEVPLPHEKHNDDSVSFDCNGAFVQEDPNSQASLEDLCRSHLDALLASIAETEKQTELAARVSTWKQRIENTLEEQDSRPPFDIHAYGERILDKLCLEADDGGCMSFVDVVGGQAKHDVARTFSAMLQLVNNGNIALDRRESGRESVCYTAANPFRVQLLDHEKRRGEMPFRSSKKRVKSPSRKGCFKGQENKPPVEKLPVVSSTSPGKSSPPNGKLSVKIGKSSVVRCTPEGKRRRRPRLIMEPVDLQSAG
ncbi:condensin-2 complex subunit H2 [Magnolia sinica]|uniref:condensin-2 complex subunit H2 n=1 Tax=Magnolia sinica TaxID=86752 RepID=UPI00265A2EEC|nr:condensin-2 complex subunit H2 [Magnolia sinica]